MQNAKENILINLRKAIAKIKKLQKEILLIQKVKQNHRQIMRLLGISTLV